MTHSRAIQLAITTVLFYALVSSAIPDAAYLDDFNITIGYNDSQASYSKRKPHQTNLLFIIFDDLRVELSIFGKYGIISPNFERLAARSVVFDHAYSQIAVCNPSRDSLLTGLRPDTVGTYGFQSSYNTYDNHMILPTRLKRSGYTTASFGKIRHWENNDPEVWDESYFGSWYQYQSKERHYMNSSVMPDKIRPEETFPDHIFATKAIETLKMLSAKDKYFMVALGFKNPHLAMHVPYEYYDMYRSKVHLWNATDAERSFPPSTPMLSYRCCADTHFRYMNQEGAKKENRTVELMLINETIPLSAYQEMMWGYAALITFVDKQLGRVLDAIDELELWGNLTVVLTADHGMHNGEKGIWEKWSLFDESTHVPLIIAHPLSPFKGQRYSQPVELIDIFPTINDLLAAPFNKNHIYGTLPGGKAAPKSFTRKFIPLQRKSLAPLILGRQFKFRNGRTNSKIVYHGDLMPSLNQSFALSQAWRCAANGTAHMDPRTDPKVSLRLRQWDICDATIKTSSDETSVMGYSMRTLDFRYTMYIPFLRPHRIPIFNEPIFAEELYDHRDDKPGDLGHKELINLSSDKNYSKILQSYRRTLRQFLWNEVVYLNISTTFSAIEDPSQSRKDKKRKIPRIKQEKKSKI